MWVTVLASQPSVSIETETTQRIGLAEAVLLADGVHHLAQQVLVGDVLAGPHVAGALDDLAAEALDLVRGHVAEVLVERLAGFELFGVDQQRARPGQPVAVLVVVPEERKAPVLQRRRAVVVLAVEAGDEVVDQLRGRGVVADHDEDRRDLDPCLLPERRTSSA